MSPAVRLGAFLALIVVLFAAAFFVGSRLGPVSAVHGGGSGSGSGSGGGMSGMHMGITLGRVGR